MARAAKVYNYKWIAITPVNALVGSFQAFLLTSLISSKSTLLTWIDHEFQNIYWLWTVRIALGIIFVFFE